MEYTDYNFDLDDAKMLPDRHVDHLMDAIGTYAKATGVDILQLHHELIMAQVALLVIGCQSDDDDLPLSKILQDQIGDIAETVANPESIFN